MTELPEVHVSRHFEASPAEVYRAFVEPEQLARWFGPQAFHCPVGEIDIEARPGGHWRLTMVAHDDPGQRRSLDSTLLEVVEDRLLVGYDVFPGMPGDGRVTWTVELRPEGDGTRLELRQGPFPEPGLEGAAAGWQQAFDKLDPVLAGA